MEEPSPPATIRLALTPETKAGIEAIASIATDLGPLLKSIGQVIVKAGRALLRGAALAYAYWDANEKVAQAGWIPSLLIPYPTLVERLKEQGFSVADFLESHFQENTSALCEKIMERIAANAPDRHCIKVLGQAVAAHRNGLHHCVPPTIFSEVERVIRLRLNIQGRVRTSHIKTVFEEMKRTNLAALAEVGPLALTDILIEQIYQDTRKLSQAERRFLNRHVVVHGFEIGNGFKDSMNALLLADSLISYLKWRSGSRTPVSSQENVHSSQLLSGT